MPKERLVCIVCGRKFPRGQGIVLIIGGKEYSFHSKACALKFVRRLLEEIGDAASSAAERVAKEFAEELRAKEEARKKKIV